MKGLPDIVRRTFAHRLAHEVVLVPLLFTLVWLLGDWRGANELQVDEGFNLAKAALLADGHRLYRDLWSDQPPLLTYVLSWVHQGFPFSIVAGRVTILVFALVLATSLFRLVWRFEGAHAAWAAIVLLALSEAFLTLSVSVMIGLPAIALATLALDLATARGGRGRAPAMLAGALFGAALLTKMFVMGALPAFLAAFWIAGRDGDRGQMRPALLRAAWFGAGAATFCSIALAALGGFPFDQLVAPHVAAKRLAGYSDWGGIGRLYDFLADAAHLALYCTILFGPGAWLRRPAGALAIPGAWLALGCIVLATHRPLWGHQVFLLVVPLAWVGGVGLARVFHPGRRPFPWNRWLDNSRRCKVVATPLLFAALVGMLLQGTWTSLRDAHAYFGGRPGLAAQSARTAAALLGQDKGNAVLITDRPILAFRHRMQVPPRLAVWSSKRMTTGRLTEEEILAEVAARPGAAVLLERFSYARPFLDRIAALRHEVGQVGWPGVHLFVPKTPRPALEEALLSRLPGLPGAGSGGVFAAGDGSPTRLERPGSGTPLAPGAVVARPPGSAQEVGACLVAAAHVTGSTPLAIDALGIGMALYCTQTRGGGWTNSAVVPTDCGRQGFARHPDAQATFDDGTMTAILHFAFDLQDLLEKRGLDTPPWLHAMRDRGFAFILRAQAADGSWPQRYGAGGYHRLATLNDDAMTGLIRVLLAGYERLGRTGYLAAARRGGDFLLAAQATGDTPAFAQQYFPDLQPAPARSFEPAGHASLETAYAINALIDLHLATGGTAYRQAAERAADWLQANRIAPETWARLYAPGSGRPLYGRRDGTVTHDIAAVPENERAAYRWTGGRETFPDIGIALDRVAALRAGQDRVRALDAGLDRRALLARVPGARVPLRREPTGPASGPHPATRAFVEYCATLLADGGAHPDP